MFSEILAVTVRKPNLYPWHFIARVSGRDREKIGRLESTNDFSVVSRYTVRLSVSYFPVSFGLSN